MKYFLPTEIPRLSSYPVFLPPPPPAAHPAEAATYINQQIQVRNSPGGQCACANFPPPRLAALGERPQSENTKPVTRTGQWTQPGRSNYAVQ